MKYINPIIFSFFILLTSFVTQTSAALNFSSLEPNYLNSPQAQTSLHCSLESPATVGVIPYYITNDAPSKIIVFLGRQRANGGENDSGTFSDFGGNVEKGTLFENLQRVFFQGTMKNYSLDPDQLKSGLIIFDGSNKEHPISYVLYPFSKQQVENSLALNGYRYTPEASTLKPEELKKDQFYWFDLNELLSSNSLNPLFLPPLFMPIKGKVKVILPSFFAEYFIKHPALAQFVKETINKSPPIQKAS